MLINSRRVEINMVKCLKLIFIIIITRRKRNRSCSDTHTDEVKNRNKWNWCVSISKFKKVNDLTKIKNCVNFDLNSGSIERLVRNICFIRDIQISPRQYLNIPFPIFKYPPILLYPETNTIYQESFNITGYAIFPDISRTEYFHYENYHTGHNKNSSDKFQFTVPDSETLWLWNTNHAHTGYADCLRLSVQRLFRSDDPFTRIYVFSQDMISICRFRYPTIRIRQTADCESSYDGKVEL